MGVESKYGLISKFSYCVLILYEIDSIQLTSSEFQSQEQHRKYHMFFSVRFNSNAICSNAYQSVKRTYVNCRCPRNTSTYTCERANKRTHRYIWHTNTNKPIHLSSKQLSNWIKNESNIGQWQLLHRNEYSIIWFITGTYQNISRMSKPPRSIFKYIMTNFFNSFRPRQIRGNLMGEDYFGNKYYEIPASARLGKRKPERWFEPAGDKEAFDRELTAEWESWLRGRRWVSIRRAQAIILMVFFELFQHRRADRWRTTTELCHYADEEDQCG